MKASWIGPLTRIAMLLGVCALAPAAQAQLPTIHIWPSDVPPCHTTLQACVDGAASGDQIRSATNGPISEEIDFSKSLTLRAQSGFQPVFSGYGITASTGSSGPQSIRIEGLRFVNSVVFLSQASTGDTTFRIVGNHFENGAISIGGNTPGAGAVSFEVSDNTLTGVTGHGISIRSSTGQMTGSVRGNTIVMAPGLNNAILLGDRTTTDVVNNHVSGESPGIRIEDDATARIVGNVLLGPGEELPLLDGIEVDGDPNGFIGVDIVNNTIAGWDRGIVIEAVAETNPSGVDCLIANDLITHNRIGVDNEVSSDFPGAVSFANNLFFANSGTHVRFTLGVPIDLVVADPLYVSATDVRLRPGSPAIDAGDAAFLPDDVTTDLAGNPRIQGEEVDIGAYEAPEPGARAGAFAALLALALARRARRHAPA